MKTKTKKLTKAGRTKRLVCDGLVSRNAIEILLKLARHAHSLCDNADEAPDTVSVDRADYDNLCADLDALDTLPDLRPEAADGPRKAEVILSANIAAQTRDEDGPDKQKKAP